MALLETDPVCLALDSDGDIVIPMRYLSGLDAVVQGCRTRMLMVRGEWFADRDYGVPYFEDANFVPPEAALLGQDFDEVKTLAAFRRAVVGDSRYPGVPGVESADVAVVFDRPSRALTVTIVAHAVFGDTPPITVTREI